LGESILLSSVGSFKVLTLNRPESANAMNKDLLLSLAEVTAGLRAEEELSGLVVTGAGKAFSTGGDPRDYQRAVHDRETDVVAYGNEFTGTLATSIKNIRAMPFPVVAAVNGQAAGAGFSLALACDLRVAVPRAAFHLAYGRIGASTDGGMTWLLPRVVSPARALHLLLEQPVIRAPQALAEGIVTMLAEPGALLDTSLDLLRRTTSIAPHSIKSAKRLVDSSLESTLDAHLEEERAAFAAGLGTRDMRHGIDALLAGEWPDFEGR
jgi:enoyl-CoA hydratase/carnithine racemase